MPPRQNRVALLAASSAMILAVTTAQATPRGTDGLPLPASTSPSQTASKATGRAYAIPALPLGQALAAFGRQAGIQVTYAPALIAGKTAPALSGTMSREAALQRLLSSSGLSFRYAGTDTIVVQNASSSNITLGPVRVGGATTHQNPTGPGIGYVAENTLAGTKTDTPLTEIPNSIYVITKQQMIDQQPQNVMEALRYAPGISTEVLGGYTNGAATDNNNGGILQRGFTTSQFVDGIRSYSDSAAETAFLDRVEVFNGPASVMYGQTTPGGMIGMSLKKPTDTPLRQVSVGFGNWGRYEATLDVSDKVTRSGNVRYRIAAIGVTQGTQTNHIDYHRVGVLPSIAWDIDPRTSLTLVGSYLYTPGTGTNNIQLPPSVLLNTQGLGRIPRSRFFGDAGWNTSGAKDAMFEYQFRHDFNRSIQFSQTLRWEQSRTNDKYLSSGGGMIDSELLSRGAYNAQSVDSTIGLDSRIGGKFDIINVKNTWIVGSDFRQYTSNGGNHWDDTPGSNGYPGVDEETIVNVYNPVSDYIPCMNPRSPQCLNGGYHSNTTLFQEGVYFQDQIKYKRLSITLGGRQDWVNYHGTTQYWNNENASHQSTVTSSSNAVPRPQNAFTWRAGLTYTFDFGLTPYFSYSTSFVPQSLGGSGRGWDGKLFDPLTGKQLEAGLKYQTPDHNVMLTAAAFHIDEDHYLVTDPVHTNYSADAGRVRSEGFELSANANVTHDLKLVASYTYDNATYLDTNESSEQNFANGTNGALVSQKGKYIESVPRNMVSAFADYTLPGKVFRGFGINGGLRYVGSTYSDAVNSFKIPDRVLFDIGAHYDFGQGIPMLKGLRAQVAISNLTNKYYITSCGGTYSCYLGQGRKIYGNLTYNW
ncbi:TonB-dependent siderophore receptor [Gluconacetobacter sp.]|uniref:TonB-dependent siderophore receptor n=1 Tax=Gluconacetobacter sp. TaxID=1935994 RepID=UPI0039EA5D1A